MVYAILSRILFCRDLRTFVWRKIKPKITYVEKKWQISGMTFSKNHPVWWRGMSLKEIRYDWLMNFTKDSNEKIAVEQGVGSAGLEWPTQYIQQNKKKLCAASFSFSEQSWGFWSPQLLVSWQLFWSQIKVCLLCMHITHPTKIDFRQCQRHTSTLMCYMFLFSGKKFTTKQWKRSSTLATN